MPQVPISGRFDYLLEESIKHRPDCIFLQMDPMHYITRQRFMSQKCALNE